MLLAGGQGSRLYVLTGDMAKPAVPFGGKFRIIDFPLSNCVNSGIDTVAQREIDNSVLLFVTATDITHCHLTSVVTSTCTLLTYYKRLLWCTCSDFIKCTNNFVSLPRCCGL